MLDLKKKKKGLLLEFQAPLTGRRGYPFRGGE